MITPSEHHPTATGRQGEAQAARYLQNLGHTIVAQNWRNRYCELDLVTIVGQTVHIVEVKYRSSRRWGAAVEYIVPAKIDRLNRAGLAWCQAHNHHGPWQIDIVTVEGSLESPEITYFPNATFA